MFWIRDQAPSWLVVVSTIALRREKIGNIGLLVGPLRAGEGEDGYDATEETETDGVCLGQRFRQSSPVHHGGDFELLMVLRIGIFATATSTHEYVVAC